MHEGFYEFSKTCIFCSADKGMPVKYLWLEFLDFLCYITNKESTHSKVDAPKQRFIYVSLRTPPLLWIRQEGHFYLCLFLLSRKVSNATIKPPKDISKANIPRKIIIISYAVMCVTSLPMYSGCPVFIGLGGYHPVMGAFLLRLYHINREFSTSFGRMPQTPKWGYGFSS
mgnify:CR=1 FL=1